ncbi:CDP-glycerol glycerophosphotransferase family protein, partial [Escherichia marmotae]|nr:CDP-glycerol glycerophosphotransferase family protein [Escherichia marmotae]
AIKNIKSSYYTSNPTYWWHHPVKYSCKFNVLANISMNDLLLRVIYVLFSSLLRKRRITFASNFDRDIYLNLNALHEAVKKSGIKTKNTILFRCPDTLWNRIRSLFVIAQSKVLVVDCSHYLVSKILISKKTKIVYVGHGGGCLKKMGYSRPSYRKRTPDKEKKLYGQYSYVLSTTSMFDENICINYNVTHKQLLRIGLPRTDILFRRENDIKNQLIHERIILFAPSYSLINGTRGYLWNFEFFDIIAQRLGYKVWFSPHPDTPPSQSIPSNWFDCSQKKLYEKIHIPVALVTDVSSIMFDFCITSKPILIGDFYDSDADTWIPKTELPGVNICKDYDDIHRFLSNLTLTKSSNELFQQQMDRCDGNACDNFVRFIKRELL